MRRKLPLLKEELEAEMFEYIIAEFFLSELALSIMRFRISKPDLKVATTSLYQCRVLWYWCGCFRLCQWGTEKTTVLSPFRRSGKQEMSITEEHLTQRADGRRNVLASGKIRSMTRFEENSDIFDGLMAKSSETLVQQGLMKMTVTVSESTNRVSLGDVVAELIYFDRAMGLTYQNEMKIPFDVWRDMNGHVELLM